MTAEYRRLVYVAKSHIPSRWANSVQVVHMVCALARHFREVELLVPFKAKRYLASRVTDVFRPYGRRRPGHVRVVYLRGRRGATFEGRVRSRGLPREGALVYTRSLEVAAWVGSRGGSVLYEAHEIERDRRHPRFRDLVRSVGQNPRAAVVCISGVLERFYREQGIPARRVRTFPDGVDERFFSARPGGALRRMFGPRVDTAPKVVYTGSLAEEKGARFLAAAARELPRHNFVIVGGSREEARALAALGRGLENLFVHPAVPHLEVPGVLAEADVLVMPYLSTGKWVHCMSPLKMFEYLASGKVLVSSRLPVLLDVLADGTNCILFEPGSVGSLAAALEQARQMPPEQARALGTRARETAWGFRWDSRAERILAWYGARAPEALA